MYYVTNTQIQRGDARVKQWNGLLKKEWLAMNGWLYGSITTLFIAILVIPFASSFIFDELSTLEISPIFSFVWVAFSILLPTVILLASLNREMVRPDIWLHSTAPTAQLFGIKMLFASIIGLVNVLLPSIIVLIQSGFAQFPLELPFKTLLQLVSTIGFMFFLIAIFIMCTGLFLGVIYQLLKPVVKGFAGPIVVIIFLLLSWLQTRITESTIYTKIAHYGRFNLEYNYINQKENFFFEFASSEIYAGELLINFVMATVFFIAAIVLFEKKVRL